MRRTYDPLEYIPRPHVVRAKMSDLAEKLDRLKLLLEVSVMVHTSGQPTGLTSIIPTTNTATTPSATDDAR